MCPGLWSTLNGEEKQWSHSSFALTLSPSLFSPPLSLFISLLSSEGKWDGGGGGNTVKNVQLKMSFNVVFKWISY